VFNIFYNWRFELFKRHMDNMINHYERRIQEHTQALEAAIIMQDAEQESKHETSIEHYQELLKQQ